MSKESQQMFKNQIIIQKALNPKKKLKVKKIPKQNYPFAKERVYYKFIKEFMMNYTEYVKEVIIPQIPEWLKELQRLDSVGDEIELTINGFSEIDDLLFNKKKAEIIKALEKTGYDINQLSDEKFKALINSAVGIQVASDPLWVDDFVKMFTQNNVSLISGLTEEYIKKINNTVMSGMQSGATSQRLTKQLLEINEQFTGSRARLIARDQIGKFWGGVNRKRQNDIGVKYYIWRTVTDERVRESHSAMEGRICDWNDSSIYSNDVPGNWNSRSSIGGVNLHPGEDYQCRCYSEPYLEDILNELEE